MSKAVTAQKTFLFVFPAASGHLNPALPLARSLVEAGHSVHFLCFEPMRDAIEDTGATFHSSLEILPELYTGRRPGIGGAIRALQEEYGLPDIFICSFLKLHAVQLEMQLPGMIRLLNRLAPATVIYCPVASAFAAYAASVVGVPSIALLTFAGPGARELAWRAMLADSNINMEEFDQELAQFAPNREAVARLKQKFGLDHPLGFSRPFGMMDVQLLSQLTLVTTIEDLQDPMTPELAEAYEAAGAVFAYVGPLLDQPGAVRAGTHRDHPCPDTDARPCKRSSLDEAVGVDSDQKFTRGEPEVLAAVREARSAGRKVVLVSMGTVITSDADSWGWHARPKGVDGKPRGLSGQELCQAAWAGAFDALGASESQMGPLLVISVGLQTDPLGNIVAPPNALCLPSLPQVDLLRVGVDLFLTHGGQNSMIEALSQATPLVVCPGFGDQTTNARKAVALGVGVKVDRPDPDPGCEPGAASGYRQEISCALQAALSESAYKQAAADCARRLERAGGVPRAVELVLDVASAGDAAKLQKSVSRGGA